MSVIEIDLDVKTWCQSCKKKFFFFEKNWFFFFQTAISGLTELQIFCDFFYKYLKICGMNPQKGLRLW